MLMGNTLSCLCRRSRAGTADRSANGTVDEGVELTALALRVGNNALDALITVGEVVPIFGSFFELMGHLRDKWQALVQRNDEAQNVGKWAKRELRLLAPIRRRVEQLSKEEKDESCAEDGSLLGQAVADATTSISELMKIANEIKTDTCCHGCCFESPSDCCHGLVLKKEDFESAKEDVEHAREFFDRALAVDTNITMHKVAQWVQILLRNASKRGKRERSRSRRQHWRMTRARKRANRAALTQVLPHRCKVTTIAEADGAGEIHCARIGVEDKAALDTLRDGVVLKLSVSLRVFDDFHDLA